MFELTQQPRTFCPNSKSRPYLYRITTDEHISQVGTLGFFTVTFNTGGEGNGIIITLAGETFTTNNASPYTFNTFDASGTPEECAQNLKGAIESNHRFEGFFIFLSSGGGSYTVQVFNYDFGEVAPWSFDISAFTIDVDLLQSNGLPYIIKNLKLWYRVYNNVAPISIEKYTDIPFVTDSPFTSEVQIDIKNIIKGVVRTTPPNLLAIGPTIDIGFYEEVNLRVGIIETDVDCNTVYKQSIQSSKSISLNSVFQLHETKELQPHCIGYTSPVKFLTNRPNPLVDCITTHEWAHIWLELIENMFGDFRIIYTFYRDQVEAPLSQAFTDISVDKEPVQVDLGPANVFVKNNRPSSTDYYTIQVWVKFFDEETETASYIPYSELLTRKITTCNCNAAEIYFIEDRGSWMTLVFEEIAARIFTQTERGYEQPIDFEDGIGSSQLYIDGGRYSLADDADQVFILKSAKFTESERYIYEQLLRSPSILIKSSSDIGVITRRVILDRQNYTVHTYGEVSRLEIPFRFNNKVLVH